MMQAANTHPLAASYLERLRAAAGVVPAGDAADLVADVGEHLDVALADIDRRDPDADTQVRAVLERLGEPSDLVAAASEQTPQAASGSSAPPDAGASHTASVARARRAVWFLLGAGLLPMVASGLVAFASNLLAPLWPITFVMWAIGMWSFVATNAFTARERLWGRLVLGTACPANIVLVGGVMLAASMALEASGDCSVVDGMHMCTQSRPISAAPAELIFGIALVVTPVILQLVTAGILLRRLNHKVL